MWWQIICLCFEVNPGHSSHIRKSQFKYFIVTSASDLFVLMLIISQICTPDSLIHHQMLSIGTRLKQWLSNRMPAKVPSRQLTVQASSTSSSSSLSNFSVSLDSLYLIFLWEKILCYLWALFRRTCIVNCWNVTFKKTRTASEILYCLIENMRIAATLWI